MNNNLSSPIEFFPPFYLFPNEYFVPITDNIIPGIMNYYIISNYARIFNTYLGRFVAGIVNDSKVWLILSTIINNSMSTYQIELDKLMLLVFNTGKNNNYIKHNDGLRHSYYIDNLSWTDISQIPKNQRNINGQKVNFGEDCFMAKLNDNQVHEICRLIEKEEISLADIARKYNVTSATISEIKKGKTWKHISMQYKLPEVSHDYKGEKNPSSKVTEKEVRAVCRLLEKDCYTLDQIAKKVGGNINESIVHHIKSGRTWKHISDQYNIPKPISHRHGETNPSSKITEAQAITICELLQSGIGSTEISKMLNISKETINGIKFRCSWTYIGKNYNFDVIPKDKMCGENIHNAIYSNKDIKKVCELLQNTNKTQREISKITNVSTSTINGIVKRRSWTSVSKDYSWDHRTKYKKKL